MNTHKSTSCYLIILILLSACTREKETKHDYPRVVTGQVTNINASGATFNGTFLQTGNSEIIDHGFVYGTNNNPTIQANESVSLGASTGNGTFAAIIGHALEMNETYYVSAYARNKEKIFYAQTVTFVSKGSAGPEIEGIIPVEGIIDEEVTITGKNFSRLGHNNVVEFNDLRAYIKSSSDSVLVVSVPTSNGKEYADVSVTTAGRKVQLLNAFRYLKPVILGFTPNQAVVGDTIQLLGENFRNGMEVRFNQYRTGLWSVTNTDAKVIVPACRSTHATIFVTVDGHRASANESFSYIEPEIVEIVPNKGVAGDIVAISGKNFGYRSDCISVFLGGRTVKIIESTNTVIKIQIPDITGIKTLPLTLNVDAMSVLYPNAFTYN